MRLISAKTILGLSALLLTAACTDELAENPADGARPISFTPAAETRAAVEGTTLHADFNVWGGYDNNATNVFNGVTVQFPNWTYTGGTQYWIPGKTYNFYGVYPTGVGSCNNGIITVDNFDCSKFGEEAVDLMTATATGDGSNPKPVAMEFKHQLSKVNIVATVEGGNCTVNSVTFSGMATKGSYNSTDGWSDPTIGNFTSNVSKPLNTTGVDLLGNLLLIPQTVTDQFKISVNYTLDGEAQTKEISLPTSIGQWEAGQSYKYTLTFKGNNIIFTVNVASWGHSTGGIITVE